MCGNPILSTRMNFFSIQLMSMMSKRYRPKSKGLRETETANHIYRQITRRFARNAGSQQPTLSSTVPPLMWSIFTRRQLEPTYGSSWAAPNSPNRCNQL